MSDQPNDRKPTDVYAYPGQSFYSITENRELRYLYPDSGHPWAGWIIAAHPDGGWYSFRKATERDIAELKNAAEQRGEL